MKLIDNFMKKRGFVKITEDRFGVYYERHDERYHFNHVVCVLHKKSGEHIMQSYDSKTLKINNDYINEGCGVEIPVLLAMWIKAKWMSHKYHWRKKGR